MDTLMNKISSYRTLLDAYGSKIIELDVDFNDILLTYNLIKKYLELTITEQIDLMSDEDNVMYHIISQYGIGNYDEAYKDYEEFSVIFN